MGLRWPLLDLLRSRHEGLDPATVGLLAMVGLLAIGTAGASVAPGAWLLRSHHQVSPIVWVLTQPIPFMYTGEHRVIADFHGEVTAEARENWRCGQVMYRQHAPMAALTGPVMRPRWRACGLPADVSIHSRQATEEVESHFRVELDEDGGILVRRAEPPP